MTRGANQLLHNWNLPDALSIIYKMERAEGSLSLRELKLKCFSYILCSSKQEGTFLPEEIHFDVTQTINCALLKANNPAVAVICFCICLPYLSQISDPWQIMQIYCFIIFFSVVFLHMLGILLIPIASFPVKEAQSILPFFASAINMKKLSRLKYFLFTSGYLVSNSILVTKEGLWSPHFSQRVGIS